MDDDRQVLAYQQTVPWFAWVDQPVRDAIAANVAQSLRELVIAEGVAADWDTLVAPEEVGRQWRHDTGETFEDGSPVYAYLPTAPEEDPDAVPTLVLVRAAVTVRARPKATGGGTLSA